MATYGLWGMGAFDGLIFRNLFRPFRLPICKQARQLCPRKRTFAIHLITSSALRGDDMMSTGPYSAMLRM
jgi:hypothetical protein